MTARRILVIDDELTMARIVRRALRNDQVDTARSGPEGLERAAAVPYDAVLCDYQMPEMDGVAVYRALRDRIPELASRFILMTGGTTSEEEQALIEGLELAPLEKPFSLDDLRSRVAAVLPS
jgi:DNA-binding response OmpR family regulator